MVKSRAILVQQMLPDCLASAARVKKAQRRNTSVTFSDLIALVYIILILSSILLYKIRLSYIKLY